MKFALILFSALSFANEKREPDRSLFEATCHTPDPEEKIKIFGNWSTRIVVRTTFDQTEKLNRTYVLPIDMGKYTKAPYLGASAKEVVNKTVAKTMDKKAPLAEFFYIPATGKGICDYKLELSPNLSVAKATGVSVPYVANLHSACGKERSVQRSVELSCQTTKREGSKKEPTALQIAEEIVDSVEYANGEGYVVPAQKIKDQKTLNKALEEIRTSRDEDSDEYSFCGYKAVDEDAASEQYKDPAATLAGMKAFWTQYKDELSQDSYKAIESLVRTGQLKALGAIYGEDPERTCIRFRLVGLTSDNYVMSLDIDYSD